MKNIELIFESVNEIPVNRKARRNKTIEILVSDKIFRSNTLAAIIGKLKYLLKYKEEDFHINIIFKNTLQFGDKITYILLDSILYYTLIKSSFKIFIKSAHYTNILTNNLDIYPGYIHNLGFESSTVFRTLTETKNNFLDKEIYLNLYTSSYIKKDVERKRDFYRKMVSNADLKYNNHGIVIYQDLRSILQQHITNDKSWIKGVSKSASELLDNVHSHTESDCILDINIEDFIFTDNKKYTLVNIGIINLGVETLYSKIKSDLENESDFNYGLFLKIRDAKKNHELLFDDKYDLNHFYMITTFQNHVTTKTEYAKRNLRGTGLNILIRHIIDKAKTGDSYVLSGKNIIRLQSGFLEPSEDGFIGFNKERDYFNSRPDSNVLAKSDIYVPGTIYNLLFVKEC